VVNCPARSRTRNRKLAARSPRSIRRLRICCTVQGPKNGSALDPLPGEVGGRVIGPGRAEFPAAMGASSVVVGLVLGHHDAQVLFAEDQHLVGHLRPGGEHKSFGISVRLRAAGRDLHL
jgi:hypothetical protein